MINKILFICLLFPLGLFAQGNVTIRCTIEGSASDTVRLIPDLFHIAEYERSYSATLINQHCEFSVVIDQPGLIKLNHKGNELMLFAEPGDQLQIHSTDDSLTGNTVFSGSGAAQNQWLTSFYKQFADDFDGDKINAAIISTDADAYEMKLFEQRKKQLAYYNAAEGKASFSDAFKNFIEHTIRYNYYARLLSYPIIQANQSTQVLTVKAFPAVMLEGIDSTLLNDQALNAAPYRDFLYYYTVYFTSEANGFRKFKDLNLSLEMKVQTARQDFKGQSLTWSIAFLLNNEVNRVSQYTAKHIYSILSLQDVSGTYTGLLKSKVDAGLKAKDTVVDNVAEKPASGAAPDINYPKLKDLNGKFFTFSDLKGKVVYVDFWASWCGPCRQQMPYSKQLHGMFNEKQLKELVFLYVSIDATEEAWKAGIQQLGIEGMHGISPGNWQSPIAKFFGISGIPRYMLINKKGEIVDLNAKRPGMTQEIYNDILKLIE